MFHISQVCKLEDVSHSCIHQQEGVENFHAWKYRIGLILEENDLAKFIKENVPKPEEDAAKAKCKKDMIRAKRIIANSIKDHLIPQVASKNTPKEMFDALTRMYEGKNINRKMNLRTQLKNRCRKEKQFKTISLELLISKNS
jgi:hypothetical protein